MPILISLLFFAADTTPQSSSISSTSRRSHVSSQNLLSLNTNWLFRQHWWLLMIPSYLKKQSGVTMQKLSWLVSLINGYFPSLLEVENIVQFSHCQHRPRTIVSCTVLGQFLWMSTSTIIYQDSMVWKLNRSHCVMFFRVYINLCTVTVIELIVFSYNDV